ncbi:hypothetical protein DFAR_3590005 [Desulfarculales bacterium]
MRINLIRDKLRALGMEGMLKALKEQLDNPRSPGAGLRGKTGPNGGQVSHPQKKSPTQKQVAARIKLRHDACLEDIDYRQRRRIDEPLIMALASCR